MNTSLGSESEELVNSLNDSREQVRYYGMECDEPVQ